MTRNYLFGRRMLIEHSVSKKKCYHFRQSIHLCIFLKVQWADWDLRNNRSSRQLLTMQTKNPHTSITFHCEWYLNCLGHMCESLKPSQRQEGTRVSGTGSSRLLPWSGLNYELHLWPKGSFGSKQRKIIRHGTVYGGVGKALFICSTHSRHKSHPLGSIYNVIQYW